MMKYDNAGHGVSVRYVLSAMNRNHSPCPPDKEEKDTYAMRKPAVR